MHNIYFKADVDKFINVKIQDIIFLTLYKIKSTKQTYLHVMYTILCKSTDIFIKFFNFC